MITYNCVMVKLTNPGIKKMHDIVIDRLGKYIKSEILSEYAPGSLVDPDPHITLIYDLDPIGLVFLNKYLRVNCRKELFDLKSNPLIQYQNPIINTFPNDDFKVLKIDFSEVQGVEYIRNLSAKLNELPNSWKFSDPYQPHLTLTYLDPSTPDDLISSVAEELSNINSVFMIESLLVSNSEGNQQVLRL